MQDPISMLSGLRRPRLMMRAARIGAEAYRREAHLPRILGYGAMPRHAAALIKLIPMEAELEARRQSGDAGYNIVRHLDVLIAMVAEARILRATSQPRQTSRTPT